MNELVADTRSNEESSIPFVTSYKVGESTIEILKKFESFAILQVSRGLGPRALQEWLIANTSLCFPTAPGSDKETFPADNTPTDTGLSDKYKQQQERKERASRTPVVASHHYRAYWRGLVLVAANPTVLDQITGLSLTTHCLVRGHWLVGQERVLTDKDGLSSTAVSLAVSPSNTAGFLTMVSVRNTKTTTGMSMGSRQFRKHLKGAGYPVLGNAEDATSFRGESLLLSAVELKVYWKKSEQPFTVTALSPPKLLDLMQREARFWKERNDKTLLVQPNTATGGDMVASPYATVDHQRRETFGGLSFLVTPAVMIPRKGSEVVVERAVNLYNRQQQQHGATTTTPRILDLGTGSGCLLLTLLHQLETAHGVGIDISNEALDVAKTNAQALNLTPRSSFCQGTFVNPACQGVFDICISNPPYHTRGSRHVLDAATSTFEPSLALYVDGDDYVICYRQVLEGLTAHHLAAPGTVLVFEVFCENADRVASLMKSSRLEHVSIGNDTRGCVRTVEGIFPEHTTVSHIFEHIELQK